MSTKEAAPVTGGADESGTGGSAAGLAETPADQDELHDGGLDLYDIDAEY